MKDIAKRCKFWVSEGSTANIRDDTLRTAWTPEGENPELRVGLPEEGAAWIQIDWSYPPTNYTITEYDADRNAIATHTPEEDEFACIAQLLPLSEGTRYVSIAFSQEKQGICKILVYPEGELPPTAVRWEKPLDKCDLMVVSTHQDDEWLWFGAIIPYYDLVRGKDVQVVYMANCGRHRYQEALNGLAVSGVRTFPQFVGLKDKYDKTLEESLATWHGKEAIIEVMVEQIRRFKPEVILTHDWNGEYGHPQHKLTSRCMESAIEAAADPEQYPETAEKYGAWQVKKLYRHLEEKGRIAFDWHVAYLEFGGRTGMEVAKASMAQHVSQLKYYHVEDHGKYDNTLFGLSYSAVGDDVLHDDLFENIPESSVTPAPESTVEAEPETSGSPKEATVKEGDDAGKAVVASDQSEKALRTVELDADTAPDALLDAEPDGAQEIGQTAGGDGAQEGGQEASQEVSRDASPDAAPDGAQETGRTVERDGAQNAAQEASQEVSRDASPDAVPDGAQETGRTVERDGAQNAAQDISQEISREDSPDALQVDAQNAVARDAQGASVEEENLPNRADAPVVAPTPVRRGRSTVLAATLILAGVVVAAGGAGAVFVIRTRVRASRRRRRAVRTRRAKSGGARKRPTKAGRGSKNAPRRKGKRTRNSSSNAKTSASSSRRRRA